MDYLDFRFAVPGDWVVSAESSCVDAPGAVLLNISAAGRTGTCEGSPALREWLQIVPTDTSFDDNMPVAKSPAHVGTLPATQIDYITCDGCAFGYRFANGYEVKASGSKTAEVLATFTDSGARRALQDGPLAETSTWQTIRYEGINFRVPSSWTAVDLPSLPYNRTDANGVTVNGAVPYPGVCGGATFPMDEPTRTYLGVSGLLPSCPNAPAPLDLGGGEGAWVRPGLDGPVSAYAGPVARGKVHGLDVTIIRVRPGGESAPTRRSTSSCAPAPRRCGCRPVSGSDASTARSILRSLHSTPQPAEEATTTTSTMSPVADGDGRSASEGEKPSQTRTSQSGGPRMDVRRRTNQRSSSALMPRTPQRLWSISSSRARRWPT